jgi:hypothetical protein
VDFLEIMQAYFRGERIEALAFIAPAGVAFVVLAFVALRAEGGAFGWSMAVPLFVFGLVAAGTGLGVGLRTPGQVAALEESYRASPSVMVASELPRMQKVNANWPIYLSVWAGLVAVGLTLRFAVRADWAHGMGPAFLLIGASGFLIDGFAERRARPYTAALEAIAAPATVAESQ